MVEGEKGEGGSESAGCWQKLSSTVESSSSSPTRSRLVATTSAAEQTPSAQQSAAVMQSKVDSSYAEFTIHSEH